MHKRYSFSMKKPKKKKKKKAECRIVFRTERVPRLKCNRGLGCNVIAQQYAFGY